MVSTINSADPNIMQLMAAMYQKMSAADTDGTAGLSKSELSSLVKSDGTDSSPFLKTLVAKFDDLDSDGDGQLSGKEIGAIRPHGPLGPPPGLDLGTTEDVESASVTKSVDGVSSTDSTKSNSSIEALVEKLLKQLKEALSGGTQQTADADSSNTAKSIIEKLTAADTDGTSGLSKVELSSIDTGNDSGKANFIKNLTTNFDKIDTNADGQLSQAEITASKPVAPPPGLAIANGNGVSSSLNSLANLSGEFVQKLISSYQNGSLSSLASSFNLSA